jgi:hypothetical protein
MILNRLLEWGPLGRVRRIHGLEHAAIHLLSSRNPYLRLVGRSTPTGFYLYGAVETEKVAEAAGEALARLQNGQSDLAIHPRCGTNLAVVGILAGMSSLLASTGRSRSALAKLPRVLLAATVAAIVSQPLAIQVQKYITTSPNPIDMRIGRITRQERGKFLTHFVEVL